MKIESLSPFNILKQGDTKSEFRFKVLDYNNVALNLTNKTVSVIIANDTGKILEKVPTIDSVETGVISFSFDNDDLTGFGEMRLEVHVIELDGTKQIIPAQGYYKFIINQNLNDLTNGVTSYSLEYFMNKFDSKVAEMDLVKFDVIQATSRVNVAVESANSATILASEKATLAETNANYAKEQGDYSKIQGDYAKTEGEKVVSELSSLTTLKVELNTKITESTTATENANLATTEATTQAQYAKEQGDTAKSQGSIAEGKGNIALSNATQAFHATDEANVARDNAQLVADNTRYIEPYNPTTQYKKNNIVSLNGSSYIAKQDTLGNTPVGDIADANWGILAIKGVDGQGSVGSVNSIQPDENGNVLLTPENIGASPIDHTHIELHTHANEIVIDGLSDVEGQLQYKGSTVGIKDYNALINKPTIPTTTSQLTNDSDFATNLSVQNKMDVLSSNLGDKTALTTTETANLVVAINEINAKEVDLTPIEQDMGDLAYLSTTDKTNLVAAVSEVKNEVVTHLSDFAAHQANEASHGIYTDKELMTTKYKLVVINGKPFLEVVSV